jgi:hypothetical protein
MQHIHCYLTALLRRASVVNRLGQELLTLAIAVL